MHVCMIRMYVFLTSQGAPTLTHSQKYSTFTMQRTFLKCFYIDIMFDVNFYVKALNVLYRIKMLCIGFRCSMSKLWMLMWMFCVCKNKHTTCQSSECWCECSAFTYNVYIYIYIAVTCQCKCCMYVNVACMQMFVDVNVVCMWMLHVCKCCMEIFSVNVVCRCSGQALSIVLLYKSTLDGAVTFSKVQHMYYVKAA